MEPIEERERDPHDALPATELSHRDEENIARARRSTLLGGGVTVLAGAVAFLLLEDPVALGILGAVLGLALLRAAKEYRNPSRSLQIPPERIIESVLIREHQSRLGREADESTQFDYILQRQDELDRILEADPGTEMANFGAIAGMLGCIALMTAAGIAILAGESWATILTMVTTGGAFGGMAWYIFRSESRKERALAILAEEIETALPGASDRNGDPQHRSPLGGSQA